MLLLLACVYLQINWFHHHRDVVRPSDEKKRSSDAEKLFHFYYVNRLFLFIFWPDNVVILRRLDYRTDAKNRPRTCSAPNHKSTALKADR